MNHYSLTLCNTFLDFMACHGLEQMNLQPTRFNSILDVFLTKQPLSVSSVKVLPGISDHEAVLICLSKTHPLLKENFIFRVRHTINHLIADFTIAFLNHPINTPVQFLWDSYKTLCADCLQLVPTKIVSSSNSSQPWETPLIRRLSRRSNACIIVPS